MAEPGWPRHVVRVGVFEFRRSVRAIRRDKARFALMALGVVVPSMMLAGFAVLFAGPIRDQVGPTALPGQVRSTVAVLWSFGVFVGAQRVASARTRIEAEPLVLTAVSVRTAAGGLVLAETLRSLAYVGLPVLTITGVLIYLFGSPLTLVTLPVAALLLAGTAAVVGSIVGYAVAWLVTTSGFVARHKTVLGSVAALAVVVGYVAMTVPQFGVADRALFAWVPTGWFADLAVVGTPIVGSDLRVIGAIVESAVIVVAGGALVEREAAALWFADPVSVGDRTPDRAGRRGAADGAAGRSNALSAAVRPFAVPGAVDRPTRRVAEWVVLRTRRDPRRLTFLLLPIFALVSPLVGSGIRTQSIRDLAAPAAAVLLPWLAGASFGMNPLGDEGTVLPVTLTSISGERYVRGVMVPGVVAGLPIAVLATLGASVVSPRPATELIALAVLGGFLTGVSVSIAPAIGMAFPRFAPVRIGRGRAVLPPRVIATALHAALTLLPGTCLALLVVEPAAVRTAVAGIVGYLPALLIGLLADGGTTSAVAGWFGGAGRTVRSTAIGQLQLVLGGGFIVGGVLVAAVAYRRAVRRFERFSPP